MTYHQHGLNLSQAQLKSVSRSIKSGSPLTLRLTKHRFVGKHPFHLTTMQMKKLHKHHTSGKGLDLRLSGKQLKTLRGLGFWDAIKTGVKAAAKAVAPMAIDAVSSFAKKKLAGEGLFDWAGPLANGLNSLGDQVVQNAVPIALTLATKGQYSGQPMQGRGLKKKGKKGDGFGDWLKAGAKGLAKSLGPLAIDAASDFAKKKIEGSGVRKRGRKSKGKGIFAPGMSGSGWPLN